MNDWQPIETAPKDNKEFLAWGPYYSGPVVVKMSENWGLRASWDGELVIESDSDQWGREFVDLAEITHWMPLPNPPSQE